MAELSLSWSFLSDAPLRLFPPPLDEADAPPLLGGSLSLFPLPGAIEKQRDEGESVGLSSNGEAVSSGDPSLRKYF
jgi:hypothetical protein